MDRQQGNRLRTFGLRDRLADGQVGVNDLVEVADEVANACHGQVALEAAGELENLAQVQQRPRAAVTLGAQLRPAQVAALFEQPVEDVGDGQRVPQLSDPVGQLDQANRLGSDLLVHLGKALLGRFVEAVAQPHA